MKQEYIVQWMTPNDYLRYMGGSNEYNYTEEIIIAENAQEAIEKCQKQYPQAVVNEHPQLKTEKEKKEEQRKKEIESYWKKQEEEKQAREEWRRTHPKEYEEQKRKKRISRYKTEIKKAEEKIEQAKKDFAYWTSKLEKETQKEE